MSQRDTAEVLQAVVAGDRKAAAELLPLLYGELRKLAEARMSKLPPGQTIQATALVHEAYMRLVRDEDPGWDGRAHFFGAAAQAMREILIEHARRRSRLKRGGDRQRVELSEKTLSEASFDLPADELLSLDEALDRLSNEHPRPAQVVMHRYYGGLTTDQTADVLGLSKRTVERDWRFAQAWMLDVLGSRMSDS